MAKQKGRTLKAAVPKVGTKVGKRRHKLGATLRHVGDSVSCQTLQEAIMAWQRLPAEQKGTATIKVDVRGGAVYSPAEIERLAVWNRSPRFPPPWLVEEHAECFMVKDANGQTLGHFYYDDEPQLRAVHKRLSKEEARRIAVKFAKLPELLRRP